MHHHARLTESRRQRPEETRGDDPLAGAMPGLEMAASAAHRGGGFEPQRGQDREPADECARTMRGGLAERNDRKQEQSTDADDAEKGRRLNEVTERLKGSGISS